MVVVDSGPLIAFARLSRLALLRDIFEQVLVPDIVVDECTFQMHRPGAQAIREAPASRQLARVEVDSVVDFADAHLLDAGESATLMLAQANACPALLDERRGRGVAIRLGIPVVGTVGALLAARLAGQMPVSYTHLTLPTSDLV